MPEFAVKPISVSVHPVPVSLSQLARSVVAIFELSSSLRITLSW
ncbi:MAG: hypothetical protein R3251_00455 [Candidatus Spechtbacterales bacterium]|nr:hypothetical protein [Candidatus Spechtbacterales bacterium]